MSSNTEDKNSRTEAPTQKRLDDAFKEGNFPKSSDIGVVFVLGAAFTVLAFHTNYLSNKIGDVAANFFSNIGNMTLAQDSVGKLLTDHFGHLFIVSLPMFASVTVAAMAAGALQTGLRLTPKVIEASFSKLNPIAGFKKLFSSKNLVRGLIDLLKFIGVMIVIYAALQEIMQNDIFSTPISLAYIGCFIKETALTMLVRLILILSLIAFVHYLYERYKINRDLMMTKQEVKDERKEQEGSSTMKRAMRSMSRRLMQKQMLSEVPIADVIVTNPTHFAVALKYETGKDLAPIVVAKGENMFAIRIKDIARQHEVPMVENVPVARLLYKIGKVGEPIPSNLYRVIAQILALVYKTNKYYFHTLKARRNQHSSTASKK